jgi:uncharacterized membrane protein YuzA (DUF378 family)
MKKLSTFEMIAVLLVAIGAINWGLVGAFHWNLVDTVFSFAPIIATIIYILVGLSGLWMLVTFGSWGRK